MPSYQPKRYQDTYLDMLALYAAKTGSTDVSDTSAVKHIFSAVALAISEAYYQLHLLNQSRNIDLATGDDLNERAADIMPGTLARTSATKAVASIVFSRVGTVGTVTIPTGTKVKTADGTGFTTTGTGTITAASTALLPGHVVGQDSTIVPAIADKPGAAGNVAINTLVKFSTKPPGVDAVTNLSAGSFGTDLESDDSFRNRIRTYVAGLARCTPTALATAVVGAQDPTTGATVLFSHLYEDPLEPGTAILYVDDGTGRAETFAHITGENVTLGLAGPPGDSAVGGETLLFLEQHPVREASSFTLTSSTRGALTQNNHYFLNPATGQLNFSPALAAAEVITADYTHYTGLVALAQTIVDGDLDDPITYPGARAAGILVRVRPPTVLIQNVTVSIVVKAGYDEAATRTAVNAALVSHINNLPISGDVLLASLYRVVMDVTGVSNSTVITPAADVILLDSQLARTTSANISVG